MALFDDFWGAIGDVASVVSFWSSLRSVCDVLHRRTIPDIVLLLTYLSMYGSTLSGFCYALPFADADWETFSPWFLVGELLSFLLTSYYVKVVFYRCAPTLRWCALYGFCFLATPCLIVCFFTSAILNPTEKSRIVAKKASGWLYAVLSCIMYLMTLIQVMMQSGMSLLQKCQSVSLWSVGTNSMSCYIWFTYAVLNGDNFTLVPNIVGLIVSILLLIMCAYGREHPVAVGPIAADPAAVGPVAANPAAVGPVATNPAAIGPVAANPATVEPVAANHAAIGPVAANPAAVDLVAADPASDPVAAEPAAGPVAADPIAADPTLIAAAPALAAIADFAHVAATHATVTIVDSARVAAIAARNSAHIATARATIADSTRVAACVAIVNPVATVATVAIVAARAAATAAANSARAGASAYAARATAAARAAARDPAPDSG